MIRYLTRPFKHFAKRENGSATIEFVLLFPAFMTLFLASAEVGILTLRNVILERSTDIVVRNLRLGIGSTPTNENLKTQICEQARIFRSCESDINIELRRINTDTWIPAGLDQANCVDRTEEVAPVIEFTPGGANDVMLIRVCIIFDPFFPTAGLASRIPLDGSGGYAIVASSAFVVEP